ncbi:WD40-repeat-containing domain protein [Entophlyctis helioformis]|nr:WD40-repeat-containing domain protein [Entophlyctis helioformis]
MAAVDHRLASATGHGAPATAVAADRERRLLASVDEAGELRLWDVAPALAALTAQSALSSATPADAVCLHTLALPATASGSSVDNNDDNDDNDNDAPEPGAVAILRTPAPTATASASDPLPPATRILASLGRALLDIVITHTPRNRRTAIAANHTQALIALADDTGRVSVLSPSQQPPFAEHVRLRGVHGNIATSAAFRPHHGAQLYSGGMDYAVVQWDAATARRGAVRTCEAAEMPADETDQPDGAAAAAQDTGGIRGLNPPFVGGIAFDESGDWLAAGLGDGSIEVVRWTRKTVSSGGGGGSGGGRGKGKQRPKAVYEETSRRLVGPHKWSVVAVEMITVQDRVLLVSASIDGVVCVWHLPPPPATSPVTADTPIFAYKAARKINALAILHASPSVLVVALAGTAKQGAKTRLSAFAIDIVALPIQPE